MTAYPLPDEAATQALGAALAPLLHPTDVIALHGDLGVGKTTLSRGLIRALCGPDTPVASPTYNLVQLYETAAFDLWHFDLYRLESADELIELGWDETPSGVALIEWPDRAGAHLPRHRLDIFLSHGEGNHCARLEAHGEDWHTRLNALRF